MPDPSKIVPIAATERLARRMARAYACKLALYAIRTRLLPCPESKEEWRRRRETYVDDFWWDYLDQAEKILAQGP